MPSGRAYFSESHLAVDQCNFESRADRASLGSAPAKGNANARDETSRLDGKPIRKPCPKACYCVRLITSIEMQADFSTSISLVLTDRRRAETECGLAFSSLMVSMPNRVPEKILKSKTRNRMFSGVTVLAAGT
jgi:hypothetical protein